MIAPAVFAALLLPLALLGAPPGAAAPDAAAGCRITIKASNAAGPDIWLVSEHSRLRAEVNTPLGKKWGPWKEFPMSNRRIRAGESATMAAELDLGCANRRQYEFQFRRGSSIANKSYGGAGTTRTIIDLGDAASLF